MAINPADLYPGQTNPGTTNYPYGSGRDVSSPGAGDGTPIKQALVNDIWGFFQAMLSESAITPSGNPDTAVASQYLLALKALFLDQSLNLSDLPNKPLSRTNLGLGTAAVANIGTGTGQIPDMSSFITTLAATPAAGTKGMTRLPGGIIFQWGAAVEAASINFTYPFPTACMGVWACKLAESGSGIGSTETGTPTVVAVNSNTSFGMSWGALTGNAMFYFAVGI